MVGNMFFYMSPQFHCLSLEVVNGESRNGDCSESLIKKNKYMGHGQFLLGKFDTILVYWSLSVMHIML